MDSSSTVRIAIVDAGASGVAHRDALRNLEDAQLTCVVTQLDDALARTDVDAAILCTPAALHARHALDCLTAGKHVLIEAPLPGSLRDALRIVALQRETGLVAMCAHTRRFDMSHQWLHRRIAQEQFRIRQMTVQTYVRRDSIDASDEPRATPHDLLWNHAAHTVDLFAYQCASPIVVAHALGLAMDLSIQLKAQSGAICTLSLSFNDDGPSENVVRYIGESGTYVARDDGLFDAVGKPIDLASAERSNVDGSADGIGAQDREFVAAIRDAREPDASVAQVLPCYEVLHALEKQLPG